MHLGTDSLVACATSSLKERSSSIREVLITRENLLQKMFGEYISKFKKVSDLKSRQNLKEYGQLQDERYFK